MDRRTALIGLAALGLAAPAAGATPKPSLQPLALQPLQLRGSHFKQGESVVVTVLGGLHASRRVTATADGTWTVTFPALKAAGRSFSVRAIGNHGSAVLWWPRTLKPVIPSPNT